MLFILEIVVGVLVVGVLVLQQEPLEALAITHPICN